VADFVNDYLDPVETKTNTDTGTSTHLIRAEDFNAHTTSLSSVRDNFIATRTQLDNLGVVNLVDSGADSTGVHDSLAAWNTAIAELAAAGGGTLTIPNGTYTFSGPPTVNHGAIHLEGASRLGTTLHCSALGPALTFAPASQGLTTAPATSTGVGMQLSSTINAPSLNLDDLQDSSGKAVNLNGLTAATIEYEHDYSASFSGDQLAFSCGASYADVGAATFTWKIQFLDQTSYAGGTNDGFYVFGGFNISGSGYTVATSTKLAYGKYHLALTYDNAHIRVWANGTKVAEQAVTGAIVQSKFHATTLGQGVLLYPEYHGGVYNPGVGVVRIPRISKSCRYAASFTAPSTTWGTADANTLWQCNFDNFQDSYVVGESINGRAAWTLVRGGATAYVGGCTVEKLTVTGGSGIVLKGFVDGRISSVRAGQSGGRGITTLGSLCYKTKFEHLLLYGSDYCFATGSSAIVELSSVALDGGAACAHLADAGITINNMDVAPEATTVYGLLWREPYSCVVNNVFFDVETATGAYLQNMVISGMTDAHSLTFIGGSFEPTSVAVPAARLSSVTAGLKFINGQFGNHGGHVFSASAGTDRVVVDESCALPAAHDWCSTAGVVQAHYRASATWNPPSVADGANTSTTVTVTGAAVGNYARAAFSIAVPAGARLGAEVTAADTVTVTLFNNTGGALDLASGTLRVRVESGD
jgi:hypothetical protein